MACSGSSLLKELNLQSFDLLPLLIFKPYALFMLIISTVNHTYQVLNICYLAFLSFSFSLSLHQLSTYHLSTIIYLPIYQSSIYLSSSTYLPIHLFIETGSYLVVHTGPNLSFLSLLSVPSIVIIFL